MEIAYKNFLCFSHRIEKIAKYVGALAAQKKPCLPVSAVARPVRMSEEVCIMHNLWSIQRESGTALVISLLLVVICLVVGSVTLTTSRIETQIASNDSKGKQALLAARSEERRVGK